MPAQEEKKPRGYVTQSFALRRTLTAAKRGQTES